jgi:thymidylate kinase
MFISFLGCDGSGKSAVIAGVTERLRAQGVMVCHGHWRPRGFGGGSEAAAATAENPHGQNPRGWVSSLLKLGWLWLNWWLGWWRFLRHASRDGVLLFDRYHADLLVDPRRYRYGGPMALARLAGRLMPQPDLVIFLDADPEVLLSRKREVSREALAVARKKYLDLCGGHLRCKVVDASQPLEDVIEDVLRTVGLARCGRPTSTSSAGGYSSQGPHVSR